MKSFPFYYRLAAWVVLISFWGIQLQVPVYAEPVSASPKMFPSESIGRIESEYSGTSGKTLIYIQDAHTSIEAQKNIAKIIEFAVEKEGVTTVFEEGFEGPVPTDQYFGFMKDLLAKQKVSDYFLDQLRLGGAEYAHIHRKRDFKLIGIDQGKLYAGNLDAAQRAGLERAEVARDLNEISTALRHAAETRFSKQAKEWLRLKARHDAGELDLIHYLQRLAGALPAMNLSVFPQIQYVLQAAAMRPAQKRDSSFLDPVKLFQELQAFEEAAAKQYLPVADHFKLYQMMRNLQLLEKLNRLELTGPEYEAVRELLSSFTTRAAAEFLFRITRKPMVLSRLWESRILAAKEFYEIARERDRWTENRLEDWMKNASESKAILVFGGFHKERLKAIFQKKGLSYQIVMPVIHRKDDEHERLYQSLLNRGPDALNVTFPSAVKYYSVYDAPNGLAAAQKFYDESLSAPVRSSEMREADKETFPRIYDPERPAKKKAAKKKTVKKRRSVMKAPAKAKEKRQELRGAARFFIRETALAAGAGFGAAAAVKQRRSESRKTTLQQLIEDGKLFYLADYYPKNHPLRPGEWFTETMNRFEAAASAPGGESEARALRDRLFQLVRVKASQLSRDRWGHPELILPAPSFNTDDPRTLFLAEPLAELTHAALLSGILRKVRDTKKQKSLSGSEDRQSNVQGAFEVDVKKVSGKKVLVVDDNVTSGESALEMIKVLEEAGAKAVKVVAYGKTAGEVLRQTRKTISPKERTLRAYVLQQAAAREMILLQPFAERLGINRDRARALLSRYGFIAWPSEAGAQYVFSKNSEIDRKLERKNPMAAGNFLLDITEQAADLIRSKTYYSTEVGFGVRDLHEESPFWSYFRSGMSASFTRFIVNEGAGLRWKQLRVLVFDLWESAQILEAVLARPFDRPFQTPLVLSGKSLLARHLEEGVRAAFEEKGFSADDLKEIRKIVTILESMHYRTARILNRLEQGVSRAEIRNQTQFERSENRSEVRFPKLSQKLSQAQEVLADFPLQRELSPELFTEAERRSLEEQLGNLLEIYLDLSEEGQRDLLDPTLLLTFLGMKPSYFRHPFTVREEADHWELYHEMRENKKFQSVFEFTMNDDWFYNLPVLTRRLYELREFLLASGFLSAAEISTMEEAGFELSGNSLSSKTFMHVMRWVDTIHFRTNFDYEAKAIAEGLLLGYPLEDVVWSHTKWPETQDVFEKAKQEEERTGKPMAEDQHLLATRYDTLVLMSEGNDHSLTFLKRQIAALDYAYGKLIKADASTGPLLEKYLRENYLNPESRRMLLRSENKPVEAEGFPDAHGKPESFETKSHLDEKPGTSFPHSEFREKALKVIQKYRGIYQTYLLNHLDVTDYPLDSAQIGQSPYSLRANPNPPEDQSGQIIDRAAEELRNEIGFTPELLELLAIETDSFGLRLVREIKSLLGIENETLPVRQAENGNHSENRPDSKRADVLAEILSEEMITLQEDLRQALDGEEKNRETNPGTFAVEDTFHLFSDTPIAAAESESFSRFLEKMELFIGRQKAAQSFFDLFQEAAETGDLRLPEFQTQLRMIENQITRLETFLHRNETRMTPEAMENALFSFLKKMMDGKVDLFLSLLPSDGSAQQDAEEIRYFWRLLASEKFGTVPLRTAYEYALFCRLEKTLTFAESLQMPGTVAQRPPEAIRGLIELFHISGEVPISPASPQGKTADELIKVLQDLIASLKADLIIKAEKLGEFRSRYSFWFTEQTDEGSFLWRKFDDSFLTINHFESPLWKEGRLPGFLKVMDETKSSRFRFGFPLLGIQSFFSRLPELRRDYALDLSEIDALSTPQALEDYYKNLPHRISNEPVNWNSYLAEIDRAQEESLRNHYIHLLFMPFQNFMNISQGITRSSFPAAMSFMDYASFQARSGKPSQVRNQILAAYAFVRYLQLLPPAESRTEMRNESGNEFKKAMRREISASLSEVDAVMAVRPWALFNATPQGKEIEDEIQNNFKWMAELLRNKQTSFQNEQNLIRLTESSRNFSLILAALSAVYQGKAALKTPVKENEKKKKSVIRYSFSYQGNSYEAKLLGRKVKDADGQARLSFNVFREGERDAVDGFRMDVSGKRVDFDIPDALRALIPDRKSWHRRMDTMGSAEFPDFIEAVFQKLAGQVSSKTRTPEKEERPVKVIYSQKNGVSDAKMRVTLLNSSLGRERHINAKTVDDLTAGLNQLGFHPDDFYAETLDFRIKIYHRSIPGGKTLVFDPAQMKSAQAVLNEALKFADQLNRARGTRTEMRSVDRDTAVIDERLALTPRTEAFLADAMKEVNKIVRFSSSDEQKVFTDEFQRLRRDLQGAGFKNIEALLLTMIQQMRRPLWSAKMTLTGYSVKRRSGISALKYLENFREFLLTETEIPKDLDWERVSWHPVSMENFYGHREQPKFSFRPRFRNNPLWSLTETAAAKLGFSLKIGNAQELLKQDENAVNIAILSPANHNDFVKIREGAKHAGVNLLLLLPQNVQIGWQPDGKEVFGAEAAVLFKGDQPYYVEFDAPLPLHYLMVGDSQSQERFRKNGLPVSMDPSNANYFNDKALAQQILSEHSIITPAAALLLKEKSYYVPKFQAMNQYQMLSGSKKSLEDLDFYLRHFMEKNKLAEIVAKPRHGSQGVGITFVNELDFEPSYRRLKLLKLKRISEGLKHDDIIIQSRVIPELLPYPFEGNETERLDWNLRVHVSLDNQDRPVVSGMVVRAGSDETAINISQGSMTFLLEEAGEKLGLTSGDLVALQKAIQETAQKVFEAFQETARRDGNLLAGENVSDFFGLDLIIKREGDRLVPYVIEVNGSNSGGMWAMDSHLEQKYRENDQARREQQGVSVRDWIALAARRAEPYRASLTGKQLQFSGQKLEDSKFVDNETRLDLDAVRLHRTGQVHWFAKALIWLSPLGMFAEFFIFNSKTLLIPTLMYLAAGAVVILGDAFFIGKTAFPDWQALRSFVLEIVYHIKHDRPYREILALTQKRKAELKAKSTSPNIHSENRENGALPASSADLIYNLGFSGALLKDFLPANLPPLSRRGLDFGTYEINTVIIRKLVQETADQFSLQQGRPFLAQVYGGAFYLAGEKGYRVMSDEWDDLDIQITDFMNMKTMQQFTDLLAENLKRLTSDLEIVTRENHGLVKQFLRHKESGREILIAYHNLSDISAEDWIRTMHRWLSGKVLKYINAYLLMEKLTGDQQLFEEGLRKKARREAFDFTVRVQTLVGLLGQALSDPARMNDLTSKMKERVKTANSLQKDRSEIRTEPSVLLSKKKKGNSREVLPRGIRKRIRETRSSSVLFIPYEEMKSSQSMLRRQVFALAARTRTNGTRVVLYGADLLDSDFKDIPNVKLVQGPFQEALFRFGSSRGENLLTARNRGELLKYAAGPGQKRARVFQLKRPSDLYAAYLSAISAQFLAGVSEDAEGIISVTGEFLKSELRAYQSSLIIQMAA